MHIQILDASQIKKLYGQRYEIIPAKGEICTMKKTHPRLVPKDKVLCEEISCERTKKGMINNCALCQNINNEIFIKCKIKYK